MRADLEIIQNWIQPDSHVLDLGCGDGTLLHALMRQHQVKGYGLEYDDLNIISCIEKDVKVIQVDLDQGLSDLFDDHSFDYVIMTQTLQAMHRPDRLLKEMLRVGREGIVTFPNFGHWKSRTSLSFGGYMPVTRALPNTWYNSPNIHLCTVLDFERFCRENNIRILQRMVVNTSHQSSFLIKMFPNLLGEIALYRISNG